MIVEVSPSAEMAAWLDKAREYVERNERAVFELATLLKHAEEIKAEAQPITIIARAPDDDRAFVEHLRAIVDKFDKEHST